MHYEEIFSDDPRLDPFLEECRKRGFENNASKKNLKFDYFEHSTFFAGIQDDKIKSFSGVHNFDFDGKRYWRLGFRGVSLYDDVYRPVVSKNWRLASNTMGVIFPLCIRWVEERFGPSEFVLTSNSPGLSKDTAGRSHVVDRLAHKNRLTNAKLIYRDITYLHTVQNVWLLDKNVFLDDYLRYYKDVVVKKSISG